ncbi:hypothetical protein [Frigidibacter sp. ROC022]|uniref:hypothetical protein n=1 Tax=Frigidibacter sp. ROC022 TaxID=2971796 RepID=UPI00215ADCAC|nr:hypothetical protein [Frigidibacter sp. ROC022]MCR8725509.1 hypothetical protein [Frigidibacter sp. ROC022]
MFRFLRAGIIIGGVQALGVTVYNIALIARYGGIQFTPARFLDHAGTHTISAPLTLCCIDILAALLLALIPNRCVEETAAALRAGFRLMAPCDPDRAAAAFTILLALSTTGCILLSFMGTPQLLLDAGRALGNPVYGAIAWPAGLSVAVAGFAANTHAALLARS